MMMGLLLWHMHLHLYISHNADILERMLAEVVC